MYQSRHAGLEIDDAVDKRTIVGTSAPTTSTVGVIGQCYLNIVDGKIYICKAAEEIYTWELIDKYVREQLEEIGLTLEQKADKSTIVNAVLDKDDWVGSEAPYTQTLTVTGVTATNNCEIVTNADITAEQVVEFSNAVILGTTQSEDSITFKAFGIKPNIDLPITVIIRGDA